MNLKNLVGNETYRVWMDMLKALVPHGRTHRLSVVVASMLEYASHCIEDDEDIDPASEILMAVRDGAYDPEESSKKIMPIIEALFKDAVVKSRRVNAKGQAMQRELLGSGKNS